MPMTMTQNLRGALIANRVAATGDYPADADAYLANLLNSVHVDAGTLPEALWRARFCRPADSRDVARALLASIPEDSLACGGRPGDFLHHDDGSHRTTAPTTDGRALARFDREIRAHVGHADPHSPPASTRNAWDWEARYGSRRTLDDSSPADRALRHAVTYAGPVTGPVTWVCAIDGESGEAPDYPRATMQAMVHEHGAAIVHAAADDGSGHCLLCGQAVHPIAEGKHAHTATNAVAARTPAVVLAARGLVVEWRQRADELAPSEPITFASETDELLDVDAVVDSAHAMRYADLANVLDATLRGEA